MPLSSPRPRHRRRRAARGSSRLEVDGDAVRRVPAADRAVALGDDVVVNVQARELGLGSGGFDVLYANLTRGLELPPEPGAHVMKLPYTPVQRRSGTPRRTGALADAARGHAGRLLLAAQPGRAGRARRSRGAAGRLRPGAGGALPVSLSDTLRVLKERGLVETTVAAGACFDGDERVRLRRVRARLGAAAGLEVVDLLDRARASSARASRFGHGGVAARRGGERGGGARRRPDPRCRGSRTPTSASATAASRTTRGRARPLPRPSRRWPAADARVARARRSDGWREACEGLPLEHMGRGPDEDPCVLRGAFAAAGWRRAELRVGAA